MLWRPRWAAPSNIRRRRRSLQRTRDRMQPAAMLVLAAMRSTVRGIRARICRAMRLR